MLASSASTAASEVAASRVDPVVGVRALSAGSTSSNDRPQSYRSQAWGRSLETAELRSAPFCTPNLRGVKEPMCRHLSTLRSVSMTALASRRPAVYLHIGPPKTGTTYIQDVLRRWHRELLEARVLFPGIPRHNHFPAALDVRGKASFGHGEVHVVSRASTAGAWRRLVRKAKAFEGVVIISPMRCLPVPIAITPRPRYETSRAPICTWW